MKLTIQYLGGIEDKNNWISLTGSSTLFSLKHWKQIFNILVDAWSFQWSKNIEQLDRANFINPKKIDVIIATHAHLDHIWRIPYLVKNWFEGNIYMTELTKRLAYESWLDSISIKRTEIERIKSWRKRTWKRLREALSTIKLLEKLENNKYLKKEEREKIKNELSKSKHDIKKSKNLLEKYWIQTESDINKLLSKRQYIELLFDEDDVYRTLNLIKTVNYWEEIQLIKNLVNFKLYNAAHIEGSSIALIKFLNWWKKTTYNCLIAQDLWRLYQNPLNDNVQIPKEKINYLQIEQTYAWRLHEDLNQSINKFINEILNHKGPILIPAFSIQRSQFILKIILENYNKLGRPNIYIDSKLMQTVNEIFSRELPEKYVYLNSKLIKIIQPNTPKNKVVAENTILISSSGMAQGGSIEKWLKSYLENVNAKIIFTWYQAEWTNWRKILNQKDIIIGWEKVKNLCDKAYITWFSSHADDRDLKDFIKKIKKSEKIKISLTHWWDNRYKFKDELVQILSKKTNSKKLKKQNYRKSNPEIIVPQKGDKIQVNI